MVLGNDQPIRSRLTGQRDVGLGREEDRAVVEFMSVQTVRNVWREFGFGHAKFAQRKIGGCAIGTDLEK
jgi:hypothetical protein